MTAVSLSDRIYGCLSGGAIGDALGAPVEAWNYRDIREKHGRIVSFMDFDPG
ncbi:MAG: ADP-ribosylglycohydrolase family protein [Puniceicoccaceae bacterium]|nr:MAG: ADP-ribosylglycohydrolase family protein [Puniceicoccaceae bacterium]